MRRHRTLQVAVLAGLAMAGAVGAREPIAVLQQGVADQLIRAAWMSFENGVVCSSTDAANMIAADAVEGAGDRSGVRELYCSAARVLPAIVVEGLAGVKIFQAGPHKDGKLDLRSAQFGRYNPAFVQWAERTLVPGAGDAAFRKATQPIYDRHLRNLVRAYAVGNRYFDTHPNELARIAGEYKAAIDAASAPGTTVAQHPARRLSDEVSSAAGCVTTGATSDGVDYQSAGAAAAFWVRRSMDGTRAQFSAALASLLKTYDPEYVPKICDAASRP